MASIFKIAMLFSDVRKLVSIARLLKTTPRNLYLQFINKPKQFAESLAKIGQKQRKQFSEALETARRKEAESSTLSSSWIARGHWEPLGAGNSGDLTIWTIKGTTGYTYPGVDFKTWTAMKMAKGRNGGGAGSVFWAMYLRGFKKSTFGQFMNRLRKLSGVKGIKGVIH